MHYVSMNLVNLAVRFWHLYRVAFPTQRGVWRIERLLHKWIMAQPPQGKRKVYTRGGFCIEVDPTDFVQRTIYVSREWEPETAAAICANLRAGDTFVDVGANVGYFSLLASAIVGPIGTVLAFEPNPVTFQSLAHNIELNRCTNVKAIPVGLANEVGVARFYTDRSGNSGAASLAAGPYRDLETTEIRLDTLDRVLSALLPPPTMIKIDIEGAEVLALRGALGILREYKPVILCEVSEWSLERMGTSKETLFDLGGRAKGRQASLAVAVLHRADDDKQHSPVVYRITACRSWPAAIGEASTPDALPDAGRTGRTGDELWETLPKGKTHDTNLECWGMSVIGRARGGAWLVLGVDMYK